MISEHLFACNEPGGIRVRCVRPLEYKDIRRVYESLRSSLVSRGRELPPELALREFGRLDKLYWTVDDVGLLIVSEACDCHIFFWDKRLRGREQLCKRMAEEAMQLLGCEALWTKVPDSEVAVIAFAKRVGFKEEFLKDNGYVLLRLGRH
jgi:hypothetical protein